MHRPRCPTYVETGNEADSPRGRIYLMRRVTDGTLALDDDVKRHLDLCLNCRACETACPSGVQYGKLIEPFRVYMDEHEPGRQVQSLNALQRFMLFHDLPVPLARTALALAPARLHAVDRPRLAAARRSASLQAAAAVAAADARRCCRALKPHYGQLPEVLPAEGTRRARVALFLGCVADAFFPETQLRHRPRAAEERLRGVDSARPGLLRGAALPRRRWRSRPASSRRQNCDGVRRRRGAEASTSSTRSSPTPPAAGRMLKDYGHLLHDTPHAEAAARFAAQGRDISEFLIELGPVKPTHPLPIKATYHDACHLRHAQQIRKQPRQLLEMIPGLELVPLPESELCCGAAGSYNLTQPEMAERLGDRKAANILGDRRAGGVHRQRRLPDADRPPPEGDRPPASGSPTPSTPCGRATAARCRRS